MPSSEVRFQVVGGSGILDYENFEFLRLGTGDKWETIMTPERFDYFRQPNSPARMEPHVGVMQEFIVRKFMKQSKRQAMDRTDTTTISRTKSDSDQPSTRP